MKQHASAAVFAVALVCASSAVSAKEYVLSPKSASARSVFRVY